MPIIIKTTIPQITDAILRELQRVVEDTADAIVVNVNNETKRAHSGRYYPSRREPGVEHQASAPGESFATDTASLVGGIEIERFGLTNWVNFSDPLGAHRWTIFEFGGARIAARPTIVPVTEQMKPQFVQDCASAAIQAATRNELK